tara:strand:+ start:4979 stop:5959 length:981 start_codon:yes stop_codon:yes gene_type:complete
MKKWTLTGTVLVILLLGWAYAFFDDNDLAAVSTVGSDKNRPHSQPEETSKQETNPVEQISDEGKSGKVVEPTSDSGNSGIADLLKRYSAKTPQEILIGLSIDAEVLGSETELLLALIETGVIGVNEPLRGSGLDNQHYTALYAAVTNNKTITVEQLQRFLAFGAFISNNSSWRRLLSSMVIEDVEILPVWLTAAGLGPEYYDELYISSLSSGDGRLAAYLSNLDEYDGSAVYTVEQATTDALKKLNDKANRKFGEIPRNSITNTASSIRGYQKRIEQAEMLVTLGILDELQILQINEHILPGLRENLQQSKATFEELTEDKSTTGY